MITRFKIFENNEEYYWAPVSEGIREYMYKHIPSDGKFSTLIMDYFSNKLVGKTIRSHFLYKSGDKNQDISDTESIEIIFKNIGIAFGTENEKDLKKIVFCFQDSKNDIYFTYLEYVAGFEVKKKKGVISPEDPYGEEEWDVSEQLDLDPYGEEDWNYKEIIIKIKVDVKGDDVNLRYKEVKDEENIPEHVQENLNLGGLPVADFDEDGQIVIYTKKINDERYRWTRPATFMILHIINNHVKKIFSEYKNSMDKKSLLLTNLLNLNDKVKELRGMIGDEWFEYVKEISVEE